MDFVMVVLRLTHIIAGVFWAGSVLLLAGFITPAVRAAGPDGGKFMQALTQHTRFSAMLSAAAGLTVLAGILMYWRDSGGLQGSWITSPGGLALTIGGLAGISAAIVGVGLGGRASARMASLGREMQAAGGPPKPEQIAEMQGLQRRLMQAGQWAAILLVITIIGMASARYL